MDSVTPYPKRTNIQRSLSFLVSILRERIRESENVMKGIDKVKQKLFLKQGKDHIEKDRKRNQAFLSKNICGNKIYSIMLT